jgi:hypothetical protein
MAQSRLITPGLREILAIRRSILEVKEPRLPHERDDTDSSA